GSPRWFLLAGLSCLACLRYDSLACLRVNGGLSCCSAGGSVCSDCGCVTSCAVGASVQSSRDGSGVVSGDCAEPTLCGSTGLLGSGSIPALGETTKCTVWASA